MQRLKILLVPLLATCIVAQAPPKILTNPNISANQSISRTPQKIRLNALVAAKILAKELDGRVLKGSISNITEIIPKSKLNGKVYSFNFVLSLVLSGQNNIPIPILGNVNIPFLPRPEVHVKVPCTNVRFQVEALDPEFKEHNFVSLIEKGVCDLSKQEKFRNLPQQKNLTSKVPLITDKPKYRKVENLVQHKVRLAAELLAKQLEANADLSSISIWDFIPTVGPPILGGATDRFNVDLTFRVVNKDSQERKLVVVPCVGVEISYAVAIPDPEAAADYFSLKKRGVCDLVKRKKVVKLI